MSEIRYHIVFKGEILEGFDPAQVKTDLAHLFRKDIAQIERIFTGRSVILKKNADETTARKFQAAFQRAGARCRLEPVSEKPVQGSGPSKPAASSPPSLCPKCGYPLRQGEPCARCILAASREKETAGPGPVEPERKKKSPKKWHVYVVLALTAAIVVLMILRPPRLTGTLLLNSWKLQFDSASGPTDPVRIAWDFSTPFSAEYKYAFDYEEMILTGNPAEERQRHRPGYTFRVTGAFRIESQGGGAARVIQEESNARGDAELLVDRFGSSAAMGTKISRRIYPGLLETGQLRLPNDPEFPFFGILFQLPGRLMTRRAASSRFMDYTYVRASIAIPLSGDARFALNNFVRVGDRICARVDMSALLEEDPFSSIGNGSTVVHCTLTQYWDIETRTVLCGRLILMGETHPADPGLGRTYSRMNRTREIVTFIHKDFLGACN